MQTKHFEDFLDQFIKKYLFAQRNKLSSNVILMCLGNQPRGSVELQHVVVALEKNFKKPIIY